MNTRTTLFAVTAVATFAAACAVDQDPSADRASTPRTVVVSHLDGAQAEALLASPDQARAFVDGQEVGAGMKAVSATRDGQDVRLDFRFPLATTTSYAIHHPALDEALEVAGLPRQASPPTVKGVVPDAAELPSNVLTVVFNPGRTKRGVGSNAQGGPPLEPGREYALRIKAGMLDAQGDPLASDALHVFRTSAPLRDAVDVGSWTVRAPDASTREPLVVDFGRWIDPFQAETRVSLFNGFGRRFPLESSPSGTRPPATLRVDTWCHLAHDAACRVQRHGFVPSPTMSGATMSRPPGRRELKKERTRKAIALAARELFLSKGFDETTVDEVAEASGVSRRTVFRYYPTKESMVFPERSERIEHFQELMLHELARANDPREAVRRSCLQMVSVYDESVDELLAQHELVSVVPGLEILDATFDKAWETTMVEALTARMDKGSDEARQERLRAGALIGVIRAVFDEWFKSGGELELMPVTREALAMVLGPEPDEDE